MIRISCDIVYSFSEAPRAKWFDEEPSEEEKEEMDRLAEVAKGNEPSGAEPDDDSDLGQLMKAAEDIDLDFSTDAATKASTQKMMKILQGSSAKLDLPEKDALRMAVGRTLVANKKESAPDLVKMLVNQFGFVKAKAEKAEKKKAAVEATCAVPENAALLCAFKELAEFYFKEKNANAGATYQKVVKALKELPFAVTAENAKSLGKPGKNKVNGVGASSASKMYEFVTTGTIEKLEEKRQNAAA